MGRLSDLVLAAVQSQQLGREGPNEYRFICPSHEDSKQSPNAAYNSSKLVWHCQRCGAGGGFKDLAQRLGIVDEKPSTSPNILATYDYHDHYGELAYQIVRFHPKTFKARRPDGTYGVDGLERIPYHLDKLVKLPKGSGVFLVEGEKDVDRLRAEGLAATTNPFGAKNWRKDYARWFEGYKVWIIPDNDKPGHEWSIACALDLAPVATEVKILNLTGYSLSDQAQKGLDVSDWLPTHSVAELLECVARAPVFNPDPAVSNDYPLTDTGNAEAFAARHGDKVRWDHQRGRWLVWTGHTWGADREGALMRWAVESARHRRQVAEQIEGTELRVATVKWARSSENLSKLQSMLEVAKSIPPIADDGALWDENPWLLGAENGVLNLVTGRLEPGRPEQKVTMSVGYSVDTEPATVWPQFISELFPDHPDLVPWMQKVLGYCLTGSTREQVVIMMHGKGANGKSTLLETVSAALGDYAGTISFRTIEAGKDHGIPSDMASLVGKRFVYASETKENSALNEARLKSLSGGDRITARFMRQNEFTFQPRLHLWIGVNHKPKISDDSEGMWRRMRLVPFEATFESDTRDLDMGTRLRAELPGILMWMVQGCLKWQAEGLGVPPVVAVNTTEYRADSDPLAEWVEAKCITAPHISTRASVLYESFKNYCIGEGYKEREILGVRAFAGRIRERFLPRKSMGLISYSGIGLKVGREAPSREDGESREDEFDNRPRLYASENLWQRNAEVSSLPPGEAVTCGCEACPAPMGAPLDCGNRPWEAEAHCSLCHDRR